MRKRNSNQVLDVILGVVALCLLLLCLQGCVTTSNISDNDNRNFEDEFQRNNPNPIPPPVLTPKR